MAISKKRHRELMELAINEMLKSKSEHDDKHDPKVINSVPQFVLVHLDTASMVAIKYFTLRIVRLSRQDSDVATHATKRFHHFVDTE